MALAWIVIAKADVQYVLPAAVSDVTELVTGRIDAVLAQVVARVRGVIRDAGSVPVSETAGSVPPGAAQQHVPVLAAWALLGGVPGVQNTLDSGARSSLSDMYDRAEEWLAAIAAGTISVTDPTDPEDGGVEIGGAIRFGAVGENEEADLTSYGPATIA